MLSEIGVVTAAVFTNQIPSIQGRAIKEIDLRIDGLLTAKRLQFLGEMVYGQLLRYTAQIKREFEIMVYDLSEFQYSNCLLF
jgi:hypothetical protein